MTNAVSSHPGTVLHERFLEPRGLSIYRLAVAIDVPSSTLERFRTGRTHLTADLARRLGDYFGTGADYWHEQAA
ncbi:MAG TPA: HigA family addiction module antidote protein [Corynebacterium sp.]|jgi:addiction module HigA family antidote|uniref:HigA family addiction module antitoxin n=1 Tax=Corynebacterium sp. TaxID=1720 RepID=UPI0017EC441A|nr:HigA family addiction module antitoxin [Corynebacterium sp.]MDY0113063.1 HigA family addiction module antitoxin [Corynebacterium sp.]HHT33188.1 HigA family addiction module antidote protein [Corynebacterium sp.]